MRQPDAKSDQQQVRRAVGIGGLDWFGRRDALRRIGLREIAEGLVGGKAGAVKQRLFGRPVQVGTIHPARRGFFAEGKTHRRLVSVERNDNHAALTGVVNTRL